MKWLRYVEDENIFLYINDALLVESFKYMFVFIALRLFFFNVAFSIQY